jgi:hypothetical protein
VVLEWDPIELATAEFRSLSLYRNGTKAGNIPRDKLSTKISGLALDTEYTFHLVLRTSAGQYSSEKLNVKTHKMTDLHGITITPGIMPGQLRESLAETVQAIGAKLIDTVRIDTTHLVCTEPRGQAWEKAVEMNVPVVVPDWVKGCEREGRIVGVRGYYLDADPKLRQMGPSTHQQRQPSISSIPARDSPQIVQTPPTPERPSARDAPVDPSRSNLPDRSAPRVLSRAPSEDAPRPHEATGDVPPATATEPATSPALDSEEESGEESDDTEKGDDGSAPGGASKAVGKQPVVAKEQDGKVLPTPGEGDFSEVEL